MSAIPQENNRIKGYLFAFAAAGFWGISGTFAQYLFQNKAINTEWLVTIRMSISGVMLLGFVQIKNPASLWKIWKVRNDAISLILFAILGMLAVQYTYFAAIRKSNAATATILQYLGPVMITCYIALKDKRLPSLKEGIAIVLALAGTFLLVTHGSFNSLVISGWALFWGIASAAALAFYTLQPIRLLQKWGAPMVIGWGMLIGGAAFSFIHAPWKVSGIWDLTTVGLIAFIILFGSLAAFYTYLMSIQYIGAVKASLLGFAEPLSAAFLSVIWLKTSFGLLDWIGSALILITIILLTRKKKD